MKRIFLCTLIWLLVSLACSLPGSHSPSPTAASPVSDLLAATQTETVEYSGLNLQALKAYHARFEMLMENATGWVYQLDTRSDGELTEFSLHIDKIDPSLNPGDIRLVTDGNTNWMIGPGTQDQCLQFPSDLGLTKSFLMPDDLFSPQTITGILTTAGRDELLGYSTTHYSAQQASLETWQEVSLELWRADDPPAILRYDFSGFGPDPFFNTGEGQLTARLIVLEVAPQQIDAIPGCEIDLPLPENIARLVRLPDLISFESNISLQEMIAFFQSALDDEGWLQVEPPMQNNDTVLLAYQRDKQTLDINIEQKGAVTTVRLVLH